MGGLAGRKPGGAPFILLAPREVRESLASSTILFSAWAPWQQPAHSFEIPQEGWWDAPR